MNVDQTSEPNTMEMSQSPSQPQKDSNSDVDEGDNKLGIKIFSVESVKEEPEDEELQEHILQCEIKTELPILKEEIYED